MKKWFIALLKKMKFKVELFTDETSVKRRLSRTDISKIDWNMFIDSLIYSSTVEKQPQYSKITKEDENDFFRAWDVLVEKLSDEEVNILIDGVSKAWKFPLPKIGDVGTLDNLLKMSDKHRIALEQSKKPNEYFAKGMHLANNAGPLIEDGSGWNLKETPYHFVTVKIVTDDTVFFYRVDRNKDLKTTVVDGQMSCEEFRNKYRKGSFKNRKGKHESTYFAHAPVSRRVEDADPTSVKFFTGDEPKEYSKEDVVGKLIEYAEKLKVEEPNKKK